MTVIYSQENRAMQKGYALNSYNWKSDIYEPPISHRHIPWSVGGPGKPRIKPMLYELLCLPSAEVGVAQAAPRVVRENC